MMVVGNFANEVSSFAAPPASGKVASRLDSAKRGLLPFSLFNGLTTPIFNRMYHAWLKQGSNKKLISLYEFLFPVRNKEAYFYWFGASGFHECQIIVEAERFNSFVSEIQDRLARQPVCSYACVRKAVSGPKGTAPVHRRRRLLYLEFSPRPGWCGVRWFPG